MHDVGLDSVYKVYALAEERLEKFLLDISPAGEHFPVKLLGEDVPHPFTPVIHVRSCKAEGYHISRIVVQQVQFETMAPSHRTLSILGQPREDLVKVPTEIVAYGNHDTCLRT